VHVGFLQSRDPLFINPFGPDQTFEAEIRFGATAICSLFSGKLLDLFAHSLPCSNWFICEISDVLWLLFFSEPSGVCDLVYVTVPDKNPGRDAMRTFVAFELCAHLTEKHWINKQPLEYFVTLSTRTRYRDLFISLYVSGAVQGSQSVAFVCNGPSAETVKCYASGDF